MLVVKKLSNVEGGRRMSRTSMSSDSSSAGVSRKNTFGNIAKKFSSHSRTTDTTLSAPTEDVTAAVYPCKASDTRSCAISHNGEVTLTGYDTNVGVWNTLSGSRKDFTLHSRNVRQVAVSGDGKIGASASVDGTVRVFDTKTVHEHRALTQRGYEWAQGAALSADGEILFATFIPKVGERGCLVRLQWRENKVTKLWQGHKRIFECFASHDGSRVLFIRGGGAVQVFDIASASIVCSFEYMVNAFHAGFDSRGRHIVIADRNLIVHSVLPDDHLMVTVNDYRQITQPQCDITADGSRIIEMKKRQIVVRNARNGNHVLTLDHKEKLKVCRISADGSRIVACNASGSLVVWTPDTLMRTPVSSMERIAPDLLQAEYLAPNDSADYTSPWFGNKHDNTVGTVPGITLPPTYVQQQEAPKNNQIEPEHYEPVAEVPPPPDAASAIQYHAPFGPPPPSPPPPPELSPIEALLRETLDPTSLMPLSKRTLYDVLNRRNVVSLAALFAGHNLLLIALRSQILDPADLKSFMGVPYFFFSELYLPFYSQLGDQSPECQLFAKKIFLHAEQLGFIKDGEPILAVAESFSADREEFRRIDEVLQDLSHRVGALEVSAEDTRNHTFMLQDRADAQLKAIATLAQNLTAMHEIMKRRDRGLMYANLAKCILALLPLVGAAVGNAAFSATEILLQMSAEDMWSGGIDVSHCIIDQVANVDMSNMQVARYVFSRKGLQSAGPMAEQKIKRAIEESSFRDVAALNEALQKEIQLISGENKHMHLLNLGHSEWVSGRCDMVEIGSENSNLSSPISQAVVALYEKHVTEGEMMSYQHAIIHIGSYLQLSGFRKTIPDDTIYEVLEEATNDALRVDKGSFVASCEHLMLQLDAEGGRTPDSWKQKFEFAAKPETDLHLRTAAAVLLEIWKETEERGGSVFSEVPTKVQLRELLKEFDSNGDGRIDKDEFLRAAHYAIHGIRQSKG